MAFNIESLIGGSIGDAFQKIMSVFKVDPTVALQNRTEIEKIQLELQAKVIDGYNAQLEVNKAEASSPSMFVAGWRPAVGWVCATGLASQFVVGPLATWGASLAHHPIAYPQLDLGTLLTLLFGMLGMAGYRTYEKTNGVDDKHPNE